MYPVDSVNFCGLEFRGLSREYILNSKSMLFIVTANAQIINLAAKESNYKAALANATITFDGQIPFLLAKLVFPHNYLEKISGSDLVYDIIKKAKDLNERIFILGGSPQVNADALKNISCDYGIAAAGLSINVDDYGYPDDEFTLHQHLKKLKPNYIFVALGAPKQEYWISRNYEFLKSIDCKIVVGCGGAVDFLAKRFQRAPKWMQLIGLEGLYRLVEQPSLMRLQRILGSFKVFWVFLKNL